MTRPLHLHAVSLRIALGSPVLRKTLALPGYILIVRKSYEVAQELCPLLARPSPFFLTPLNTGCLSICLETIWTNPIIVFIPVYFSHHRMLRIPFIPRSLTHMGSNAATVSPTPASIRRIFCSMASDWIQPMQAGAGYQGQEESELRYVFS